MSAVVLDRGGMRGVHGLRALLPFIAVKRWHFIITVASGIVAQVANVVAAATGAWLVGHAVQGAALQSLIGAFWLLGGSVLAASLCKFWQTFISHDFAYGLIEVLQVGIYDGLERAAPAYVLGRRTGDLASVATADADLMEWFYAHVLGDYIGAVIVPLGVLGALVFVHPLMAAVLLPFLPLVASVPFWLAKRAGEQGRALLTALGGLNASVVEGVQGLRELAVFGAGARFLARLMQETRLVHVIQMRYGVRAGAEQAAIDVLLALAVLATVTTGLVLVSEGRLAFTLYPMAVVLAGAALAPITEVTQTARKLGELRAGADRVATIFHQKAQIRDAGRASLSLVRDGSFAFDHVRFGYGGGRGAVLDDASFSIRSGETVALVGESGAGKTTCANLLMRFWDPDAGVIRIGGCDIRELPVQRAPAQSDLGAAGCLSLQRFGRRQYPPRASRRERARDRARGAAGASARIPRGASPRLRHAMRRARDPAFRRAAPAHRDCARVRARRAGTYYGRSGIEPRHRERESAAPRDGGGAPLAHRAHYCAPALDDPRRRPCADACGRPHRRAGNLRRAARQGRRFRAARAGERTRSERRAVGECGTRPVAQANWCCLA